MGASLSVNKIVPSRPSGPLDIHALLTAKGDGFMAAEERREAVIELVRQVRDHPDDLEIRENVLRDVMKMARGGFSWDEIRQEGGIGVLTETLKQERFHKDVLLVQCCLEFLNVIVKDPASAVAVRRSGALRALEVEVAATFSEMEGFVVDIYRLVEKVHASADSFALEEVDHAERECDLVRLMEILRASESRSDMAAKAFHAFGNLTGQLKWAEKDEDEVKSISRDLLGVLKTHAGEAEVVARAVDALLLWQERYDFIREALLRAGFLESVVRWAHGRAREDSGDLLQCYLYLLGELCRLGSSGPVRFVECTPTTGPEVITTVVEQLTERGYNRPVVIPLRLLELTRDAEDVVQRYVEEEMAQERLRAIEEEQDKIHNDIAPRTRAEVRASILHPGDFWERRVRERRDEREGRLGDNPNAVFRRATELDTPAPSRPARIAGPSLGLPPAAGALSSAAAVRPAASSAHAP